MSDKNIVSLKKELNNINENKHQDKKDISKQNSLSPKHNNSSNYQNFLNAEINQRNFPSKANYFGQNNNRGNNSHDRNISPDNQSPVLNYYASLSPKYSKGNTNQYYSPEQNFGVENTKHSPNMGGNLGGEQTFNFSPSTIFNINNQKNNNYNIFNNTNNINIHQSGEIANNNINKTLAEKMEHLVCKNDDNTKNQNNDQKSDYEDENGNDEMYLLTLNISDDKENEEELNNYSHNNNDNLNLNQVNNTNTNNLNKNINNPEMNNNLIDFMTKPIENNINIDINNNNNYINNMNANNANNINNSKNIPNMQNIQNIKLDNKNEGNNNKGGMAEKIINNGGELPKPYIPNKYRNNAMEINQISFQDDNMLPSYGGPNINNGLFNNFTINNNINNNFNINNNIINNNLMGNQNYNI